jgi:hypothetical protein
MKTYSTAKSINETMNNNTPADELVMAIRMPKIVGTWYFIRATINCFMISQRLTEAINATHWHSNPPFLNAETMPSKKGHRIPKAWCGLVILKVLYEEV